MRKRRAFQFDALESRDLKSDGLIEDIFPLPGEPGYIAPPGSGYIQVGTIDPVVMTPLIPTNTTGLWDDLCATGSAVLKTIKDYTGIGVSYDSPTK